MVSDLVLLSVITLLLLLVGFVFRKRYGNMVGKVLAMTVGMMSGTVYGLLFGLYAHDLALSTIFGVLCGLFCGFCMGLFTDLLAALEGLGAGLMGGMMGAMLGCMLARRTVLPVFFLCLYLAVSVVLFTLMRGPLRQKERSLHRPRWIDWLVTVVAIVGMFAIISASHSGL